MLDIGGVLVARFRRQFEVGTKEGRAKLGNEFFHGVPFVTPTLTAKVAIKARRVLRPVRGFMAERGVKGSGVLKALDGRHLHVIAARAVKGAVAACRTATPVAA